MNMCIYIYIMLYMYISIYIYVYIGYIYLSIYLSLSLSLYTYIHIYIYMYTSTRINLYRIACIRGFKDAVFTFYTNHLYIIRYIYGLRRGAFLLELGPLESIS